VFALLRLLHLVQDQVEGDALLVEEHELLAGADLLGGDGEELLAGGDGGAEQPVGVDGGVGGGEAAAEEVVEVTTARPVKRRPSCVRPPARRDLVGSVCQVGRHARDLRAARPEPAYAVNSVHA